MLLSGDADIPVDVVRDGWDWLALWLGVGSAVLSAVAVAVAVVTVVHEGRNAKRIRSEDRMLDLLRDFYLTIQASNQAAPTGEILGRYLMLPIGSVPTMDALLSSWHEHGELKHQGKPYRTWKTTIANEALQAIGELTGHEVKDWPDLDAPQAPPPADAAQ